MDQVAQTVHQHLDLSPGKSIGKAVYQALRQTILMGEIPDGERINEKSLAKELNVSRTPIRKAMDRLDRDNLVERKSGVGIIARGVSRKDAREIFDIRRELDTLATIRAMQIMTRDQFFSLREILEETDRCNGQGQVDQVLTMFTAFNDFIYDACDMPRLKVIVTRLKNYLVYFRDISVRGNDRRQLAIDEHWNIYHAMLTGDQYRVESIIRQHLSHSLDFILSVMEARHVG